MTNKRKRICDLPPCMAERAMKARQIACKNPKCIDIDDDMLPWVYDDDLSLWLSFDGNYSYSSPAEKRKKAQEYEKNKELLEIESKKKAQKIFEIQMAWSMIRNEVLKRDNYICQICGYIGNTKLHVHHILKRKNGGTDHLDNLLTICPKCHASAERKLYNPNWLKPPKTNRKHS